jgi:hypothetical protein
LSTFVVLVATSLSACSGSADGPSNASPTQTIPVADQAHIRACADALVQTSGHATSVTAYPTTGEALRQGAFITLPITRAVSGVVYLVWMKGSFTDQLGGSPDNYPVMWMALPAGSPTAPCPTDDVGLGAAPNVDPGVLGPGVPIS